MDSYKTGNSAAIIKHATDVSTWGLARSRAIALNDAQQPVWMAVSADASGDIPRTDIAPSGQLGGKLLSIWTELRLDIFPDLEERKKQLSLTSVVYFLEGGADGHKQFSPDDIVPTADYSRVIISKSIRFTS